MCAFVHMHTHTCWIHVHTHTQYTLDVSQCWCFVYTAEDFSAQRRVDLTGIHFGAEMHLCNPLLKDGKKGATVPLPCLILCRLFAWGNCCGIYCCCILAHMFLKACSLTAEAPFFICIFFLYLGRSFVRCCSSNAAGSVICKLLLLLFSQFFLPCTYATLSPLL